MEKQKTVMFGTSLNGYKKQDVNAFIATLNANFAASEANYQRQLVRLNEKLTDAEGEVEVLREQCAALAAELAAKPEPAAAPIIDEDELAELRKKAALYDRMSGQLGDIVLTANHSADILRDEARRDAGASLENAKSTIAQNAALTAGQLESLYRQANSRAVSEINAAMQETVRSLNKLQEALAARRAAIDDMLRRTDDDLRRAADEQIARLVEGSKEAVAAIGAKPAPAEETEA